MCDAELVAVEEAIEDGNKEAVDFLLSEVAECLDLVVQFTSSHSLQD